MGQRRARGGAALIYTVRAGEQAWQGRVALRRGRGRVDLEGRGYDVDIIPRAGGTHWLMTIDGRTYPVVVTRTGPRVGVVLGADRYEFTIVRGVPGSRRRDPAGPETARRDIVAPMPGLVVSMAVQTGDAVDPGRTVAIMEAMKMQMEVRATTPGTVVAVPAKAGEEVPRGAVLVTIDEARDSGTRD